MQKQIKLGDLFTDDELSHIVFLINNKRWDDLRTYVNSYEERLSAKELVPDYVYYYLQYLALNT